MSRLTKHSRLTRAAAFVLMLIGCGCVWMLAAMVLMSSVQPSSHPPF
ncbi:hypothetical protein [Rhizobium rhizophilum]|nr:hypothetical protein [Rhizobium rhizophilum]